MSKYPAPKFMLDILSKLPVKTLLRFRYVSKQWKALITDPTFIALHAMRSTFTNNGYLLQYCQNFFTRCDRNLIPFEELKLSTSSAQIVGSCNGLVCLLLDTFSNSQFPMYLWNPSMRTHKKLPNHKSFKWEEEHKGLFATFAISGFGYDHCSNDYKILLVVHAREIASEPFRRTSDEIQVHSWRTNSWRRIAAANIPFIPCRNSSSMLNLNGGLYWIAAKKENDTLIVMSFDLHNEVFREIMVPDHCCTEHGEAFIRVFKGSIGLFVSSHSEDYNGLGVCHLYVLKECSGVVYWINVFTVDLRAHVAWQFFGFGTNGEVVLRNNDGKLVLYDPETQQFVGYETSNWFANAVTYAESLVSP